jgi:hypothetical protein
LVFSSSFSSLLDLAAALTKWNTAGSVFIREQPFPMLDPSIRVQYYDVKKYLKIRLAFTKI